MTMKLTRIAAFLMLLGLLPASEVAYAEPPYVLVSSTSDPAVFAFQSRLRQAGYYNGPLTGILDLPTAASIARFQATHGLLGTGGIDQPTAQALGIHLSPGTMGPAMR